MCGILSERHGGPCVAESGAPASSAPEGPMAPPSGPPQLSGGKAADPLSSGVPLRKV